MTHNNNNNNTLGAAGGHSTPGATNNSCWQKTWVFPPHPMPSAGWGVSTAAPEFEITPKVHIEVRAKPAGQTPKKERPPYKALEQLPQELRTMTINQLSSLRHVLNAVFQ